MQSERNILIQNGKKFTPPPSTFLMYHNVINYSLNAIIFIGPSGSGDVIVPMNMEAESRITNNTITIPGPVLNISGQSEGEVGIFFSYYTTPILFPLAVENDTNSSDVVDSAVIGASVVGDPLRNLTSNITIILQSMRIQEGLVS